jgi:hypothetical protein
MQRWLQGHQVASRAGAGVITLAYYDSEHAAEWMAKRTVTVTMKQEK